MSCGRGKTSRQQPETQLFSKAFAWMFLPAQIGDRSKPDEPIRVVDVREDPGRPMRPGWPADHDLALEQADERVAPTDRHGEGLSCPLKSEG